MLRRYLERSGDHQVYTAQDGVEALQVLAGTAFDLAFVDLHMPRMSGIDLIQQLDHAFPAVRYVVMSGMEDVIQIAQRELRTTSPLLRKPFDLGQVGAIIAELLVPRG